MLEVIDKLVVKYGQPLSEGWHRYAMLKSIVELIYWLASIVVCYFLTAYVIRYYKQNKHLIKNDPFEMKPEQVTKLIIALIAGIVALSGWITVTAGAGNVIIGLIYPDIYWIHQIITK